MIRTLYTCLYHVHVCDHYFIKIQTSESTPITAHLPSDPGIWPWSTLERGCSPSHSLAGNTCSTKTACLEGGGGEGKSEEGGREGEREEGGGRVRGRRGREGEREEGEGG